jgi:PKD domain-containing protein/carboxypeptidase family protein
MKPRVAQARSVLATLSISVLLGAISPSFSLQGDARAAAPAGRAAFDRFDAWLGRHLGAAPDIAAAGEGVTLARERRKALLELARTNPREALARALRPSVIRRLPVPIQQESESYLDACGSSFQLEVGDDFSPGQVPVSRTRRTVTVGGRTYEAQVFGRRLDTTSKKIHANGIAIDGTVVLFESPLRRLDAEEAASDPSVRARCAPYGAACVAVKVGAQTLVFENESALAAHQAALERDEDTLGLHHEAGLTEALNPVDPHAGGDVTASSAWTTGQKTVLYMRVDFSDLAGDPVTVDTAQSTMDGAVNSFYRDSSYSKTSLVTTVTPLLRMPHTAAEYLTLGDSQLLADARTTARASGFDTANFNLDIVAFAALFDGYSGKGFVGSKGVWLNGSFGSSVTQHELGHNYGVHHANLWQTTDGSVIGAGANLEHGNVFDVMGSGGSRGQFNAWFKSRFDWLTATDYTNVTASGTYRIQPIDDATATGQRALKIVKDTTKNYWVEFRQAYTSNRWAMNGAMLNWGYNTNTGSHLLDTTPGSSNNQNDAPVLVGRTFSDTVTGIHITPVMRTTAPPTMDVVVKLGTFPGNTPPTATLSANPGTVGRNSPVTLTVSASDVNGDALAYAWVLDDGTIAPNSASISKSWTTAGSKLVQCIVSDMVGGTTTVSTTVTVTTEATFSISGTVMSGGQPLSGVTISDGTRSAMTDGAGNYAIQGVPNGSYTLTPTREGYTFTPATLAVSVSGANRTGQSFTATALRRYLLWSMDNAAQVWRIDGTTVTAVTGFGGPGAGWRATSYSRNADGSAQLLWTNNNLAHLWTINANGSFGGARGFSGPGMGWTASSYFPNGDGSFEIVWTTDNLAHIWTINANNSFGGAFGLAGPGAGWTATSYSRLADGTHKVLWSTSGLAHVWTITPSFGWGGAVGLGGPAGGWTATSYQPNPDGSWQILWTSANTAQVWAILAGGGWGGGSGFSGPGAAWRAESYAR